MKDLTIVPMKLDEENAFVSKWHRHHAPVPGCKFCVGVAKGDAIVGVAIVGRPIARMVDDGWTLEVNRTCTDGTKNANSALYGACRRGAFALGYRRLITYTLPEESGSSLNGRALRVQEWTHIQLNKSCVGNLAVNFPLDTLTTVRLQFRS